ncbi:Xaa-Pro peptidase family protein [Arthrobacter sp. ISL-30]|uniref:M24 family metallopeptidase n=1 Tax=Arthrobacter sp. ISL-30 TaxID=2819109 RepID=UPI001BE63995|nr:M24 family metallopeptidase [Arthrobacter sp. ISL-30]MBT2514596.1 M24 family metallopeptidase [Arthrobacter sp. ISL-30]
MSTSTTDDSVRSGWEAQLDSLRQLAARHDAHTVVLRDPLNLSWFTGARWHVPQTLNMSCFDVVVSGLGPNVPGGGPGSGSGGDVRIITNVIEAPRLRDVEFAGRVVDFDAVDWMEDRSARLPSGAGVLTDLPGLSDSTDAAAELAAIRRVLTAGQQEALAEVCTDLARITGRVVSAIRPGDAEQHIAGSLVAALLDEGIETVALFVGGDERIGAHRHPLATALPVTDRVMVACCGRRNGMVGTITRMASFRPLGGDAQEYQALLRVEQEFLDASKPGAVLGEVFRRGAEAYGLNGFDPQEWRRHHQGGLTGFNPRELIANPGTDVELSAAMALGWNPSGAGFKVEDTLLVTDNGPRILTTDPDWPMLSVGGRARPAVMDFS